jgi:hypothetical protein
MPDTSDDLRCPNCAATNLVVIYTRVVAAELMECRACLRLYRVEHDPGRNQTTGPGLTRFGSTAYLSCRVIQPHRMDGSRARPVLPLKPSFLINVQLSLLR